MFKPELLDAFATKKILIVGDVMLDQYWWGDVTRISPEAPVPIVRLRKTSLAAGGAANVAVNVVGLGATPILIGAMGSDAEADLIKSVLIDQSVLPENLVTLDGRPTTVKTRVIAHSQQVVRVDNEFPDQMAATDEDRILEAVKGKIAESDAVVLSDYAKGLLTQKVTAEMIAMAKAAGKCVLVDPKGRNFLKYNNATILTPNLLEARTASGLDDGCTVDEAGRKLLSDHSFEGLLVTEGEHGMTLFRKNEQPFHLRANAKEVYDVTGAGDTVIAALATSIGAGADWETAATLANMAAGIVVGKVGTAPIKMDEIREFAVEQVN